MRSKSIYWLIAAVLVLALVFVPACGQQPEESTEADQPEQTAEKKEEEEEEEEEEAPEFDPDATVVVTQSAEAEVMDVQNTTHTSANNAWGLLGDSLIAFTPEGDITGILAEEWSVSEDGLVYTFKLREDVKFHSGKALTAEDVKTSFERWLSIEESPTRPDLGEVDHVAAPEEYVFEMHLKEPHNALWNALASPWASIINIENVDELGEEWASPGTFIDGTGPWKLESWERNNRMVFVRNEEYSWGPDFYENTGPAQVGKLILRVIPENATRVAELEGGGVDIVPTLPLTDVELVEKNENVETIVRRNPSTFWFGFHTKKFPVDDVKVRQAFNYAVDRPQFVEVMRQGYGEPAKGFLRPNTFGYCEKVDQWAYEYDPEKAVSLLEEAGWTEVNDEGYRVKDGKVLEATISTFDSEGYVLGSQLMQSQLKEVGVKIDIQQFEAAAMFEHLRSAEHEIFDMGTGYAGRGADVLYWYMHPSQRPAPNRFYYDNEELAEMLELSRTTPDQEKRFQLYCDIERIALQEAIWMPMVYRDYVSAYNKRLVDTKLGHPYYGYYKFLDMKAKTE